MEHLGSARHAKNRKGIVSGIQKGRSRLDIAIPHTTAMRTKTKGSHSLLKVVSTISKKQLSIAVQFEKLNNAICTFA